PIPPPNSQRARPRERCGRVPVRPPKPLPVPELQGAWGRWGVVRRDPRAAVVISWINNLTDGRPATALVTVPVSELLELKVALLTEAPPEDPPDDATTHAPQKRQRK